MNLLVLPVSGGGFVSQLGIIQHLCEMDFIPDVTLASSGGNVAAYVAAAADWKWAGIERISKELKQTLFMTPWNSLLSLSRIIGYFKCDVYNRGTGIQAFLKNHFTEKGIKKYEIWTGTYNKMRKKTRLFCNKSKSECIMDAECIDEELTQSMQPIYADGDMEIIGDASIASASIPAIVPSKKTMGEEYIDGGVAAASPLTIMREPLIKYIKENNCNLHIIYVNSLDLSSTDTKPIHNVIDNWKQATHDLIRSQIVTDRLAAYELLRCYSNNIIKKEFACNNANLKRIKQIYQSVKYSMLEIYPIKRFDIEIDNFTCNDILNSIDLSYSNSRCRFWFVSVDIPDDIIASMFDDMIQ